MRSLIVLKVTGQSCMKIIVHGRKKYDIHFAPFDKTLFTQYKLNNSILMPPVSDRRSVLLGLDFTKGEIHINSSHVASKW